MLFTKTTIKGYIIKKLSIAMFLATVSLMAVDYSQLSLDELNELRGTITVEERDAFRAEMQTRIEVMTPEEQTAFMESRQASGGQGLMDGSGAGRMNQGAGGQGLQDGSGAGIMSQGANGRRGNR